VDSGPRFGSASRSWETLVGALVYAFWKAKPRTDKHGSVGLPRLPVQLPTLPNRGQVCNLRRAGRRAGWIGTSDSCAATSCTGTSLARLPQAIEGIVPGHALDLACGADDTRHLPRGARMEGDFLHRPLFARIHGTAEMITRKPASGWMQ